MELGANISCVCGHCWKGFHCQWSEVKVSARLDALLWRVWRDVRDNWQWCSVEAHLLNLICG